MPKKLKFFKNSVIYFRGEMSTDIFLISEGTVMISSDVHSATDNTVTQNKTRLEKGKFFGLHSAIGNIPRQNDAISDTDVALVAFNVQEFEELITKNPKLSLQLMQMLSQELRQVHKRSQGTEDVIGSNVDPQDILFLYVESYYSQKDFKKVKYVGGCYLRLFPTGTHVDAIQSMMTEAFDG